MIKNKKTNNNFIIYFLLFSFILLIINIIVRYFLPREVPIATSNFQSTNRDGSQSKFLEVTYSGPQPVSNQIPKEFSIASYTKPAVNFDQIKEDLISDLNLIQSENLETIWINQDWYLDYQPVSNYYSLTKLLDIEENYINQLPTGFNMDSLLSVTYEEKNKLFPNLEITIQSDNIVFWPTIREFYTETTINNALLAEVPMTYEIDDYPIYFQKESKYPFVFLISSDMSFVKLTYFPFATNPRVIGKKRSISIDDAIENIRNNRFASIISNYQEQGNELKIESILSVDFDDFAIEYRIDEEQSLIYPFYRFSGNAESVNDNLRIEVLTPAIDITL